jgi:hypothetical protein
MIPHLGLVSRVSPRSGRTAAAAAIMVFMALHPGVSALLSRPVPPGVELAFVAPVVSAGLRR